MFRVDLQGVNQMTMIIQSNMPHFCAHTQQSDGIRCFTSLDFCDGSWKISPAKRSQESMSIMTHVGIFSPTRTLQGGAGSVSYFQHATSEKLAGRIQNLIQLIDDYLLHEENE